MGVDKEELDYEEWQLEREIEERKYNILVAKLDTIINILDIIKANTCSTEPHK